MTKQDLQQELLAKVKPGTKPSHLKRSKSADDIPPPPLLPPSILSETETKLTLALDQLKEKQQQIEDLRAKLEAAHTQLTQLTQALDNSQLARHQALKDFAHQHQQLKHLSSELDHQVDQASEELISQDQTLSQLRIQVSTLKKQQQSLAKDLDLATRIRQLPTFNSPQPSYWPLVIFLGTVCLLTWFKSYVR